MAFSSFLACLNGIKRKYSVLFLLLFLLLLPPPPGKYNKNVHSTASNLIGIKSVPIRNLKYWTFVDVSGPIESPPPCRIPPGGWIGFRVSIGIRCSDNGALVAFHKSAAMSQVSPPPGRPGRWCRHRLVESISHQVDSRQHWTGMRHLAGNKNIIPTVSFH